MFNSGPVSDEFAKEDTTIVSKSVEDTVWVEGLVPGIDFCNHGKLQLLLLHINGYHSSF